MVIHLPERRVEAHDLSVGAERRGAGRPSARRAELRLLANRYEAATGREESHWPV